MSVSIKQHFKHVPVQEEIQFKAAFNAAQADLAELRAAFLALTAKMDADFVDVTNASVDYASSVNPAELTLIP